MNRNRRNGRPASATRCSQRGNDVAIHLALLVVGCIPMAIALVRGGSWGVEPALGLLLCLYTGRAALRERALRRAVQLGS